MLLPSPFPLFSLPLSLFPLASFHPAQDLLLVLKEIPRYLQATRASVLAPEDVSQICRSLKLMKNKYNPEKTAQVTAGPVAVFYRTVAQAQPQLSLEQQLDLLDCLHKLASRDGMGEYLFCSVCAWHADVYGRGVLCSWIVPAQLQPPQQGCCDHGRTPAAVRSVMGPICWRLLVLSSTCFRAILWDQPQGWLSHVHMCCCACSPLCPAHPLLLLLFLTLLLLCPCSPRAP
jgi:hypothetical protein